jgi:hypothetical protein
MVQLFSQEFSEDARSIRGRLMKKCPNRSRSAADLMCGAASCLLSLLLQKKLGKGVQVGIVADQACEIVLDDRQFGFARHV